MPDSNPTQLQFLPWVRQGMAAEINNPDTLTPTQNINLSLPVSLWINRTDSTTPDVSLPVKIYGPGDVTGIDPAQIVRTSPAHLTTNFEPNYLPAVEFDRPDFPWLFTPLSAGENERLRPWLVLVVIKKQSGVALGNSANALLPVLQIKAPAQPAAELPDLTEAWAWAHAQVAVDSTTDAETALRDRPERTLSRLLCPRRLDPETAYLACVVPAFASGCQAGLGLPITEGVKPSWELSAQGFTEIRLPVYFSWEFNTGRAEDFESLVKLLQPRPLSAEVGKRQLDFGHAGFSLPELTGAMLPYAGVLQPLQTNTEPVDQRLRLYQNELQNIVNTPATNNPPLPIVAPPIYGGAHARRNKVDSASQSDWLNELNLDPRHRVSAAFGTEVIQHEQEELMAAAWQQLERIKAENQKRQQRQLAEATRNTIYAKHLAPLAARESVYQITGVAHAKMLATPTPTTTSNVLMVMRQQTIPEFATTALRRIARPRGALSRRFKTPGAATQATQLILLNPPPPPLVFTFFRPRPLGKVTMDKVSELAQTQQKFGNITLEKINDPNKINFVIHPENGGPPPFPLPGTMPVIAANFKFAVGRHIARVKQPGSIFKQIPTRLPEAKDLLSQLTAKPGLRQQISFVGTTEASSATPSDDTTPIMAHPEFDSPMYEALRDLHPEVLLPGLAHVPPNTVMLLQTNQKLIESFLVGLNHELARELLWREYPTDQRGTYFQHFWDARGAQALPDIAPIDQWKQPLGQNSGADGAGNRLVLLMRSELLRRYPGAIIYAVKAVRAAGQLKLSKLTEDQRYPIFRGSLPPDISFLGFANLTQEQVMEADPGWFFVIQQQPSEPNFGLDVATQFGAGPITTWKDLSWGHLVNSEAELQALKFVKVQRVANGLPKIAPPLTDDWGRNSALMARITCQNPVRVVIHASLMLSSHNS